MNQPPRSIAKSLLLLPLCLGPSCASSSGDAVQADDEALLSEALTYRDSQRFARLNDAAYASALGGEAWINVYVTAGAFDAYAAIDPAASGTGLTLPEGTIIVREVLDASGKVTRLTLMAKGPAGYNPELGDYWFAVTEPDGTPVVENGAARVGRLTDCYSCHLARSGDDFLFGVPVDSRQVPGDPPEAPETPEEPETPPGDGDQPPAPPPAGPVCGDFVCEPGESPVTCHWDCDDDDDDRDDDDRDDDDRDDDDDDDH